MPNITISHVYDWIKYVEENNSKFKRNQHFHYRGESRLDYKLLPTLYRKTNTPFEKDIYLSNNSEKKILIEFMTEAAGFINNLSVDDKFRWVEYAQHFGVPTRLMDWTTNPLVALYFSCSSNQNEDGRIYILNSLGYKLLAGEKNINGLENKLIKNEAERMIWDSEEAFPYPAVFKPYYFDRRMFAQSSQFMVWGFKKETLDKLVSELESEGRKKAVIRYLDIKGVEFELIEEVPILSEVRIDGKSKLQIQRELDNIGINHATLFPGLDGIGRSIEWRNNTNNVR